LISELEHAPPESLQLGSDFRGRDELDQQVELYTHIEAFLGRYLAPGGPGPAAP